MIAPMVLMVPVSVPSSLPACESAALPWFLHQKVDQKNRSKPLVTVMVVALVQISGCYQPLSAGTVVK